MFVWIFITIWVKLLLLINRYFHRISHRIDRQFKPQATPPCSVLNTIKFRKELFSDLMTSCKFMIKWKKHEWNLPIFTILFLHLVFCLKFVIKHFYSLFYRFEYKENHLETLVLNSENESLGRYCCDCSVCWCFIRYFHHFD